MNDAQIIRKARGAFFTPPGITRFITDWAVRKSVDAVLEPSCGEAAFLLAAGDRLTQLGANPTALNGQMSGVEIDQISAGRGLARLRQSNLDASMMVADFFDCPPMATFDAVVGNPPYIRYQQFKGAARAGAINAALAAGVRLSGLASSWAAFVIHASRFLKPNGRLGLVLPAELLTVGYAAPVRRFLLARFACIRLVMFDRRVFPDVTEEVVLLLAENGPDSEYKVVHACDIEHLCRLEPSCWNRVDLGICDKWTQSLLDPSAFRTYQRLCLDNRFVSLKDWGSTYLGAVTGNNAYFTLSSSDLATHGLSENDCLRLLPPGSRHLDGPTFSSSHWQALRDNNGRCHLFYPDTNEPSIASCRYIAFGESLGVNNAYKCRVRKPWWKVPLVALPDLFLTYMNHDRLRLIANEAGVQPINSVYGVTLRPSMQASGRALLPLAAANSLTMLGTELVGRAYGGGLLKLEPREADQLPLPSTETLTALAPELMALSLALPSIPEMDVVEAVDEVLLVRHLGLCRTDIRALREARAVLFGRRRGRARPAVGIIPA
ncbi:MAG: N-6 DNA methylase [Rhodospirillaceae bacterium]